MPDTSVTTTSAPEPRANARFRTYYSGRRVCITGGGGFIGSHLARTLLDLGAEVVAIDDLSNAEADVPGELLDRYPNAFRFEHASILEPGALDDAVERCGLVFHQAAMVSVPRSIEEPERTAAVNALGTARVVAAAERAGVARIVYAASSSAYGNSDISPKHEGIRPDPLSPYAATKLAGEHIVRAAVASSRLDGVSLRYFNIFGEGQPADSPYSAVVAKFVKHLAEGETPTIFGDGSQTRDFTHVANAVHANLLAGAATEPLQGMAINIGCGQSTSVNELLAAIARTLGIDAPEAVYEPSRAGDVQHSLADISRAREVLGYEPIVALDEGLRRLVEGLPSPESRGIVGRISRSSA